MGELSRDAFKRLTLLYLISNYLDGVYGNFRLQKVLYFAQRSAGLAAFEFEHTHLGQYSEDVRDCMEQLASVGLVTVTKLPRSNLGNRYTLTRDEERGRYLEQFESISERFSQSITECIGAIGYSAWENLKEYAHADERLSEVERGGILMEEDLPDLVKSDLDDDECEDLEMSLNPAFVSSMGQILDAIDETDFDFSKVKKVGEFS